MAKSLFLIIISSLMTIVMSPAVLTATDKVDLAGVDDNRVVETVVPESVVEEEPVVVKAPVAGVMQVKANYTVGIYVGSRDAYIESYKSLSYGALYKYNKMVYGHNTMNLLGNLSSRYEGEVITITEGGVTRDFRVAAKVYYNKDAKGYLNGDSQLMENIANTAMGHDVVLFTCAGQSLGGGDATQRLAVYADAI